MKITAYVWNTTVLTDLPLLQTQREKNSAITMTASEEWQECVYGQDMYLSGNSTKSIYYSKESQTSKNFYGDSTVVSMEEEEMESYFILDELGNPI